MATPYGLGLHADRIHPDHYGSDRNDHDKKEKAFREQSRPLLIAIAHRKFPFHDGLKKEADWAVRSACLSS